MVNNSLDIKSTSSFQLCFYLCFLVKSFYEDNVGGPGGEFQVFFFHQPMQCGGIEFRLGIGRGAVRINFIPHCATTPPAEVPSNYKKLTPKKARNNHPFNHYFFFTQHPRYRK